LLRLDRLTRQTAARVTPRQEAKAHVATFGGERGQEHFEKTPGPAPRCPGQNRGQVLPGRARSAAVLNMLSSPHPILANFFRQIFRRNFPDPSNLPIVASAVTVGGLWGSMAASKSAPVTLVT
jgi:hypothetical protein